MPLIPLTEEFVKIERDFEVYGIHGFEIGRRLEMGPGGSLFWARWK